MSPKRTHSYLHIPGEEPRRKEGSAGEEGTLLKHNYFCHSYDLTKSKYAPTLGHAQDHMHYFYYFVRNKKGRIGATFVYVTLGVIYPAMRRFKQPGETLSLRIGNMAQRQTDKDSVK